MRVVVTGASGHLGCVLVRQLADQGYDVVAVSRRATEARALHACDIEKVDADIRDADMMKRLFVDADVVIHAAAKVYLADKYDPEVKSVNVDGTRVVADAALSCGVGRFIHVSSIHVYNPRPFNAPLNERNPYVKHDYSVQYDVAKMQSELVVKELIAKGLDAVIVNPCGIIGPMDYAMSTFTTTAKLMFQNKLPGLIDTGFSWVDVRDVARTIINAITMASSGENYILGGHWFSLLQLQNMIASLADIKAANRAVPLPLILRLFPIIKLFRPLMNKEVMMTRDALLAGCSNRVIDDRKARKYLAHRSRPTLDSLQCLYHWLHQSGHIAAQQTAIEEAIAWH